MTPIERSGVGLAVGGFSILSVGDAVVKSMAGDWPAYAVAALRFNREGSLVASAGTDGTVRIWAGDTGRPRPFFGSAFASTVGRMEFSPSSDRLAILRGQRAWIMDVDNGTVLANASITADDMRRIVPELEAAGQAEVASDGEIRILSNNCI